MKINCPDCEVKFRVGTDEFSDLEDQSCQCPNCFAVLGFSVEIKLIKVWIEIKGPVEEET
jgi:hypothetical protein